MEVLIAVAIIVVAVLAIGAAPMVRRTAHARDIEMRTTRGIDVDVDRNFKRPPHEGDLL